MIKKREVIKMSEDPQEKPKLKRNKNIIQKIGKETSLIFLK